MSDFLIPSDVFIGEVKKVTPEWDITITPVDFTEHPERYTEVKIVISNQNSRTTRETNLELRRIHRSPTHFNTLIVNIAALVCKGTQDSDLDLSQKIFNHFGKFFSSKNHYAAKPV